MGHTHIQMNGLIKMFKEKFPIFKNTNMVFLDSAASTQKPQVVLDALVDFYQTAYANVHRGSCHLATLATTQYETARKTVASFLNVPSEQVIFTKGATEGINLVAHGYENLLQKEDEILVSIAEHHANFVPWQQLAKNKGAKFVTFNIKENGELDLNDFLLKLNKKTKIVAVSYMSNVLGIENQIQLIIEKAHAVGARVMVDGAQAVAHKKVDLTLLDADYFAFSGHKMYAPTGIGVLSGKKDALELLPPYQFGGDMVETVTVLETQFKNIPYKFEAGTPPFAEAIALARAIDFLNEITMDKISSYEKELSAYLQAELLKIEEVEIFAPHLNKQGIISFNVKGVHPTDIAFILAEQSVCVRVGHHCAMPLHKYLGKDITLRVSLALYNDKNDVDAFIVALKKGIQLLRRY